MLDLALGGSDQNLEGTDVALVGCKKPRAPD
jgi:hypothetical protein